MMPFDAGVDAEDDDGVDEVDVDEADAIAEVAHNDEDSNADEGSSSDESLDEINAVLKEAEALLFQAK
jgi:hypothetical protein